MEIQKLREFVSGPAPVAIAGDAESIFEDRISGQRFATEAEALESAGESYRTALANGAAPEATLRTLQALFDPGAATAKVEAKQAAEVARKKAAREAYFKARGQ